MSPRSRIGLRVAVAVLTAAGTLVLPAPEAALAAGPGWELDALSVPAAHKISRGEGVTVAVIDTGVRVQHPALDGRATEGPDFLSENDQSEPWYGRHGTAMASNVLDVAPAAKVLGLRAIRDAEDPDYKTWEAELTNPGRTDDAGTGAAIRYAADNGARVISLSLGTDSPFVIYHDEEARSIQYAMSKGVVVVASLGNEGNKDNTIGFPAAFPGVIAVAASTPDGSRAPFSSVHSYADVAAPGVLIYSAAHDSDKRRPSNGTSSAGALAAGVAALIVAKYPDLAPRQIRQVLQRTASHAARGHNPKTGYGVLNAAKALRAAADLKPEPAVVPVGKQGAGGHFGPGDDGTPKLVGQPLDPDYFVFGGILGVPGLLMLIGGVILFVNGRRAAKATTTPSPPAPFANQQPPQYPTPGQRPGRIGPPH